MAGQIWEVVGGRGSEGLAVRRGPSADAAQYPERLATGSLVKGLEMQGTHLRYRLRRGAGPAEGWVATQEGDKDLLVRGRLALDAMLFRHQPSAPIRELYDIDDGEGPLATGGYATVFRARSRATMEWRAIKQLPLSSASRASQKQREQLKSEFQCLVRLDHPSIVRFYECFQEPTCISFVTELCTGGPFSTYFESEVFERPNPTETVRLLFHDVLSAIAYCHDVGVIHRDMKPDNCLVVDADDKLRPTAKIIDFGVSVIRKQCNAGEEWLEELAGTPWYRAPEVLQRGSLYGPKADMWSVGIMLYLALTSEHPFHGSGFQAPIALTEKMAMFERPLNEEPLETAGAPEAARDLIEKLIVKSVTKRLDAKAALAHHWFVTTRLPSKSAPAPASPTTQAAEYSGTVSMDMLLFSPLRRRPVGSDRTPSPSAAPPGDSSSDAEEQDGSPIIQVISERAKRINRRHKSFNMGEVMSRTLTFSKLARFEQAMLHLIARYSSEQQVVSLRQCFQSLDLTGGGSLTKQAFRNAFKASNQHISEEALEDLILSLDADGTGKIEYTEWLAATMKPQSAAAEKALQEVFQFLDMDNSGRISRAELCQVLGDEEAEKMLAQLLPRRDRSASSAPGDTQGQRQDRGGSDHDGEVGDSDESEDDESSDEDDEGNSIGFEDFKKLITRVAAARLQE